VYQDNDCKNGRKSTDHCIVRNNAIKIRGSCRAPARQRGRKDDSDRNCPDCADWPEARPGVLLIGARTDFR